MEAVPAEFNYIGASMAFGHSAKYHQYDDVSEFMSMVAFACHSEIRYGEGKIH